MAHQASEQKFEQDFEQQFAPALENQDIELAVLTGRNCRINVSDKHEIVRLNEELQEIQRWFEDYGRNGILFPNSIINSFDRSDYNNGNSDRNCYLQAA